MRTQLALALGLVAGAFLGFGMADQAHQRRELARAAFKPRPPAPMQAAQILTCPVSAHSLAEYHRTCRARARSDSTKPNKGNSQ